MIYFVCVICHTGLKGTDKNGKYCPNVKCERRGLVTMMSHVKNLNKETIEENHIFKVVKK